MYERFYNLRERPFALSPDPEYLYLSRVHREALDSLRYGIESRAGFIVLTGEIGAGKTTLLQTLLRRLDERVVVARLVNTTLDPRELLDAILLDFGLHTTGKSKPALLRDLGQFLIRQRAEGRRPLLVVDEAQNLGAAGLEEIRLLSNMETEKSKLLQVVLAGQPNLRNTIASPELEQFRQRVVVSCHLRSLEAPETAAYINSRLKRAALGEPPRFPSDAADLVHQRSGGLPRMINVLCDATLVFGYAEERRHIDLPLVREVVAELETTGILPPAGETRAATTSLPVPIPRPAAAPPPAAGASEPPSRAAAVDTATSVPVLPAAIHEQAVVRAAQEAAARASELAERERALTQRERELETQRRVLAEEYRLLRNRRTNATAVRTPAPAGGPRLRLQADASPPAKTAPPPAEGLRGWFKRLLSVGSRRRVEQKFGHVTRS